ncbi:MAG TPA: hypothetical protein VK943_02095 [Arenibaculum sp.]|nr:hypothetical protein [Arenibaculum sp.]
MTPHRAFEDFWNRDVAPGLAGLEASLAMHRLLVRRRALGFALLAAALLLVLGRAGPGWLAAGLAVASAGAVHITAQFAAGPGRDYRDAARSIVLAPLCRRTGLRRVAAPDAPWGGGMPKGWTLEETIEGDGIRVSILRGRRAGALAVHDAGGTIRIARTGGRRLFAPAAWQGIAPALKQDAGHLFDLLHHVRDDRTDSEPPF